jgi:hypothetical protein
MSKYLPDSSLSYEESRLREDAAYACDRHLEDLKNYPRPLQSLEPTQRSTQKHRQGVSKILHTRSMKAVASSESLVISISRLTASLL